MLSVFRLLELPDLCRLLKQDVIPDRAIARNKNSIPIHKMEEVTKRCVHFIEVSILKSFMLRES